MYRPLLRETVLLAARLREAVHVVLSTAEVDLESNPRADFVPEVGK
jgi:hypothetical protein